MGGNHGHGSHYVAQNSARYPEINLGSGNKWIKDLTSNRLNQFTGGHYSEQNLSSALFIHRIDNSENVKLQVWSAPDRSKPTFKEAMKQKFRPTKKGESFGPSWSNHWFKVSLTIPAYWQQYERVQFEFDPGCEGLYFTPDGLPLHGITGGYGGDRRVEYIIPPGAVKKGHLDLVIEISCNSMFGAGDNIGPPNMDRYFQLASADLVVPNLETWALELDFHNIKDLADNLPGNSILQNKTAALANEIMNTFVTGDESSIAKCRKLATQIYGEAWEKKGEKIYEEGEKQQVWGIGHCHIDTAWLWPYSATQQKVARSWSTQINLMERYAEHRFACSSAQQYKWLEQLYPELFLRVKDKVLDGRFEPVGGSWVENDSNMPSGEALVRQFVYGQRYFESRFGKRCETAWLPDSFGLTGAYPQIIRKAGMKFFFTQKLSWNNVNRFPHSTFNWVGIDGTQVLCHMTPVDTYTAQATAGEVIKAVNNHKNLESSNTSLLVFGNGDGGGGPLSKMLENLRRIRAAANNSRDVPVVKMGCSVDEFFKNLESTSNYGSSLPAWHGELYLEFHRGTYTSHGSIKKGNRKSEILLRDIEVVATLATVLGANKDKYQYPKEKLDELWEYTLLNQFHDVLPGSAIGMVYDDAEKYYAKIRKDGKELFEEALASLTHKSFPISLDRSMPTNGNLIAVNTTFLPRMDVVKIPIQKSGAARLKSSLVQLSSDGSVGYALMDGSGGFGLAEPRGLFSDCRPPTAQIMSSGDTVIKNSSVQLTIKDGRITSLYDIALKRELIPEGQTGGLVMFRDQPAYWDAWDVEIYHLETRELLKFEELSVLADGPLRASIGAKIRYGKSMIDVTISLDALTATTKSDSRSYFVFEAKVDWHERHKFLKFEIPLNIHSDNATYETQFGLVQRPTHKNTTWDIAKFEVCGHKYADLSEYGYGVAILSESKYGFACQGNVLRISLLRSATEPDAEQDQGQHEFSWAVMPHIGHFLQSDVPQAAFLFNSPLHARCVPDSISQFVSAFPKPAFKLEGASNVQLETVKRGEYDALDNNNSKDGPTTIILRVYEAFGGHARAQLKISDDIPVAEAHLTNLLEDNEDELNVFHSNDSGYGSVVQLDFHGFEVKTVKLVLRGGDKQHTREGSRNSWVNVEKKGIL